MKEIGKNIKHIAQGLQNLVSAGDTVEEEAARRLEICKGCQPHNTVQCESCGCLLSLKSRSDSDCPDGKWKIDEN